MGLARVQSAVVVGVRAHVISVEVHTARGLPGLILVGLPDAAVNESRDRVRAAIINSGLRWPDMRITVGLSPAWLPKRGPGLDLAIALAILAADGQVPESPLSQVLALGELGLDGSIKPVAGALAAALAVRGDATVRIVTGAHDAAQVRLIPGLHVVGVASLLSAVARMRGEGSELGEESDEPIEAGPAGATAESAHRPGVDDRFGLAHNRPGEGVSRDLSEIKGQQLGKRALEVAAAGGHNLALLGRAGVGKTMLAERLIELLPDLDEQAALEVTAIHQLAGRSIARLLTRPPYCAPHHTSSRAAMVGGGSDLRPTIGMVSLAHCGVIFLDEAAEFEPNVLDALREPVDVGAITVARAGFQVTLPASVQLVLATNPCPCGNALEASRTRPCRCTPGQRRRYLGRLSGPLMDRVDLRVVLSRPTLAQLRDGETNSESTATVAARVAAARAAATARRSFLSAGRPRSTGCAGATDALLSGPVRLRLDRACANESLRGRDRVAKVAWTLADLAGRASPSLTDIDEAITLRIVDESWAAA